MRRVDLTPMNDDRHIATTSWYHGVHNFRARIYYDATDAGGIVYHTEYLSIAEHARTEALRSLGFQQRCLIRDQEIMLTVRRCNVEYISPAFLDDLVEVRTSFDTLYGARISIEQTIHRIGERTAKDDLLVAIETDIACVGKAGKPKRLPKDLKEAITSKINNNRVLETVV